MRLPLTLQIQDFVQIISLTGKKAMTQRVSTTCLLPLRKRSRGDPTVSSWDAATVPKETATESSSLASQNATLSRGNFGSKPSTGLTKMGTPGCRQKTRRSAPCISLVGSPAQLGKSSSLITSSVYSVIILLRLIRVSSEKYTLFG